MESRTTTVTTTSYHETRTVSSSSGGCCSAPLLDQQYYKGLPAILKLLEVVLSIIAYLCVQCAGYICLTQPVSTPPYFLFISFFAFIAAAILWALLLFRVPFRILRCACVNWPFIEMIFNAVVIVFYLLGDIFISVYSVGCSNMVAYKAGAAFGWLGLAAYIVDLVFLVRLFLANRKASSGNNAAMSGGESAAAKY